MLGFGLNLSTLYYSTLSRCTFLPFLLVPHFHPFFLFLLLIFFIFFNFRFLNHHCRFAMGRGARRYIPPGKYCTFFSTFFSTFRSPVAVPVEFLRPFISSSPLYKTISIRCWSILNILISLFYHLLISIVHSISCLILTSLRVELFLSFSRENH